jgi:hypothetical protein
MEPDAAVWRCWSVYVCGGRGMPTSEEYERKAAECLRMARTMDDGTNKALLLQMALAWIELANQTKIRHKRCVGRIDVATGAGIVKLD